MKLSKLNLVFITELFLFALIVAGILPRSFALFLGAILVIYTLFASLENATVLFVRSIPLFIALPLTADFDNFNTWRVLVVIIFLKWAFAKSFKYYVLSTKDWLKNFDYKKPSYLLIILLLLAILSLFNAPDLTAGAKRIIFFLNFVVLGMVIYDKASNKEFAKRLIRNSVIPVVIVVVVGYIQIISTYFIDIYQFMRIWGEGIQCRQFGEQWCNIAVQLGNTWFAYYGEQLSLRVFSLFPDSHSFPQFVLLGIPAILAIFSSVKNRALHILAIALLFLIIILSGTRGIWVASLGVVLLALGLIWHITQQKTKLSFQYSQEYWNIKITIFKKLSAYLILFFIMFAVAFPIFSSPQFLVGKSDDFLKNRLKSIIDFGETSNAQRIEIWKKTLASIKDKPFLGVGIGNYPIVLGQDIRLAKAGSSAHNLYLHVAAEMGILAGIIFIWFLWLLFKNNLNIFLREDDKFLKTYFAATLLFVPWVLIYSLTDVALFDERAFLLFVATVSLILGTKK
ncbi:MAG: O-antigen ligase family protein [Candidatus Paceibacterota bacterium]